MFLTCLAALRGVQDGTIQTSFHLLADPFVTSVHHKTIFEEASHLSLSRSLLFRKMVKSRVKNFRKKGSKDLNQSFSVIEHKIK